MQPSPVTTTTRNRGAVPGLDGLNQAIVPAHHGQEIQYQNAINQLNTLINNRGNQCVTDEAITAQMKAMSLREMRILAVVLIHATALARESLLEINRNQVNEPRNRFEDIVLILGPAATAMERVAALLRRVPVPGATLAATLINIPGYLIELRRLVVGALNAWARMAAVKGINKTIDILDNLSAIIEPVRKEKERQHLRFVILCSTIVTCVLAGVAITFRQPLVNSFGKFFRQSPGSGGGGAGPAPSTAPSMSALPAPK